MISRRIFAKRQDLDKILPKYSDILTIQSEVMRTVVYGFSDHKFAILTPDGTLFCPVHEVPKLAAKLVPELRDEVMEIYEEWGTDYDAGRIILQ